MFARDCSVRLRAGIPAKAGHYRRNWDKENTMKLAVLGGALAICAATAIVAAQQAAPTEQTQTVIGCLKGEGTAQSPWVLAGVVIPPPPPANAGRGGGAGGGRGGGRG